MPKLLWAHDTREGPIGKWLDMREDATGLRVEGELFVDDIPRARQAHALLKGDALDGLSIGYKTVDSAVDRNTGVRTLKKVKLFEVSLVTFPMLDTARVSAVKTAMCNGTLPDYRDVERWLRDEGGFSQRQAKAFVAKGYRDLVPHDPEVDEICAGLDQLIAIMRGAA